MPDMIPGPLMKMSRFGVADYIIFSICLLFSAAIGLYFGLTGGRQKTSDEFMLGDRQMSVIPVSMSLLASFMSAISVLGIPAEVYSFGFMFVWVTVSYILSMYIAGYLYIPVFYRLKLTSVYEYIDLRFDSRALRLLGVLCFMLQMLTYSAIVLYTPSLAVSVVTGLSVWVSVLSVGAVTTFYTAIGGIKAVMWTDTFQIIVMLVGMLAVVIRGFTTMGSAEIWQVASESGRMDFLDTQLLFNPNPLQRHSLWTLVVGGTFYWSSTYATNQAQVQRALSVGSLRKAQLAYWINLPGLILIAILAAISGIVIYVHFHLCDPMQAGVISATDQLYPLYVMQSLGHIPGLAGLIISAVACGSLSTLSSGLNSLATVFLKDVIMVVCKPNISEAREAMAAKIIAVVFGLITIALSFIVSSLGQILQATIALFGAFGGPIYALFTIGMFLPFVNNIGATSGMVASLAFAIWYSVGGQFLRPPTFKYPVSTAGCYISNSTMNSTYSQNMSFTDPQMNEFNFTTTTQRMNSPWEQDYNIYSISYMYAVPMSLIICTVVASIVSLATGGRHQKVDRQLLSPAAESLFCCLPVRFRNFLYCGVETEDHKPKKEFDSVELKDETAASLLNTKI